MKNLLFLGLALLFCSMAFAQSAIDSTYFWVDRANSQTPNASSLFAEKLADNNMLGLWYAGQNAPYWGDAYATIYSPEGMVLINDQLLFHHPAMSGEVVADQTGGFVLVEQELSLTMVNTTTMHYHRLHPDYQNGQFVEDWSVSDGPLDSLEISLGTGFQPVLNGDRLLIVKQISDGHFGQQAPSYYVQVLDLITGTLLRDDPVTYFGDSYPSELAMIAYAEGFVLQNSAHTAFLSADGELVWVTENAFPHARPRLSIRGEQFYSIGIVGNDVHWNDYLHLTITDLYDGQQVRADTLYRGVHWYGVPVWQDDVLLIATAHLLFAFSEAGEILDTLAIDDVVLAVDLLDNHLLWYQSTWTAQKAIWFEFDGFSFVRSNQFSLPGYMAANDAARPYSQAKVIISTQGTYSGMSCDYVNNYWVTTAWGLLLDQVSIKQPIGAPQAFELKQNYPNPFNPTTNISFHLPFTGQVRLVVCNLLGQQVAELVNDQLSAGDHELQLDASNLSSGTYFCVLTSGQHSAVRKMLLLK